MTNTTKKAKIIALLLVSLILITLLNVNFPVVAIALEDFGYDIVEIDTRNGYCDNDTDPLSGRLDSWFIESGYALDMNNRSVGVDLGAEHEISKIELYDSNSSTRVSQNNYTVYVSNDNYSYIQTTSYTFTSSTVNNKVVHTFNFQNVEARYVKIHTSYSDQSYTFALEKLQQSIKVSIKANRKPVVSKKVAGLILSDTQPLSSALDLWNYSDSVALDCQNRSVGVDVGSVKVIDSIELRDTDSTNRVTESNYSLYYSFDNISYTEVTGWSFNSQVYNNQTIHTFTFPAGIKTRYLKINTDFSDSNYTFILSNPQDDIRVYLKQFEANKKSGYIIDEEDFQRQVALGSWGYSGRIAIDYNLRSVGVDLGSEVFIDNIQLWDSDNINRILKENYKVYVSNDNVNYSLLYHWTFSYQTINSRKVHEFRFPEKTKARYIKINTDFDDTNFTFVLSDLQNDIKVYLRPQTTTPISDSISDPLISEISATTGYCLSDTDPSTGQLGSWNDTSGCAIDLKDRSIGVDLGSIRRFGKITLSDSDSTSRLNEQDYDIYISYDNNLYTRVTDWSFSSSIENNQLIHTFKFTNMEARYIKIITDVSDNSFTFVLPAVQDDFKVYSSVQLAELKKTCGFRANDTNPTTTSVSSWGYDDTSFAVDYSNRSIGIDLGQSISVSKIELWNADTRSRLSDSDYTLYSSNDNISYSEITNFIFTPNIIRSRMVHTFEFANFNTRYIKICTNVTDTNFVFYLNDFQDDIKVYNTIDVSMPTANKVTSSLGLIKNDENPSTSSLGYFGYSGVFSFDNTLNSIGADLGSTQTFNKLRLYDEDYGTNIKKTNLSIYISNDNSTYTKIENFDFLKQNNFITLYNFSASARYVKVHQNFNNYNWLESNEVLKFNDTFTSPCGCFQNMMGVYNETSSLWTLSGNSNWSYRKSITINNTDTEDVYDKAIYISKTSLDITNLISQSKVNTLLNDIRFANSNNEELYFYQTDQGFYLRIPFIQASSNINIYMYYGNTSAQNRSDGTGTFQVEYGNKTISMLNDANAFECKPIKLSNGSLLMLYNSIDDNVNGDIYSSIYSKISSDNGQTWGAEELVADIDQKDLGSSAVVLDDGTIVATFVCYYNYTTTNSLTNSRCDLYVIRSSDNGVTWGTPTKVTTGYNYNLTYSNPIQITNGDIILPFHFVYTDDGAFCESVIYSTDNGLTWTKSASNIVVQGGGGYEAGATEGTVIQLSNGDLKMYFRQQTSDTNHLGESTSTDNGRTWTAPASDSIIYAPNTMPSTLKDSSNILLLWSGNNCFSGTSYYRMPLTLAYSENNTQDWMGYKNILSDTPFNTIERIAYTQPDMAIANDGSYYFVYPTSFQPWYGVRIEDANRWLYRTQGSYDGFEGISLNNNWINLNSNSEISMVERYSGLSSLRFRDEYQADSNETIKSFNNGINQGSIKFKLYASDLTSGLEFSLRECYSHGLTADGTMFQLHLTSDGSLKYMNSSSTWAELPVATDINLDTWIDFELKFDTATNQCELFINGSSKGTFGYFKDENIINYFYITSQSIGGTGTEVYIDDLIITDTSISMPTVSSIGSEEQL